MENNERGNKEGRIGGEENKMRKQRKEKSEIKKMKGK